MDACREVNDHPKALFRRASAHAALMNYEAALEDFRLCREVSPAMAKDVDRCDTDTQMTGYSRASMEHCSRLSMVLLWCVSKSAETK